MISIKHRKSWISRAFETKTAIGRPHAHLCSRRLGFLPMYEFKPASETDFHAQLTTPFREFDQIEILQPESKALIRGDQECHLLIGMETTLIAT